MSSPIRPIDHAGAAARRARRAAPYSLNVSRHNRYRLTLDEDIIDLEKDDDGEDVVMTGMGAPSTARRMRGIAGKIRNAPFASTPTKKPGVSPAPVTPETPPTPVVPATPTEDPRRGRTLGTGQPIWRTPSGALFPFPLSDITYKEKRRWLSSSANWGIRPAKDKWRGVKVLGIGAYGLVGLWQDMSWTVGTPSPQKLVVKQSRGVDRHLESESDLLTKCRATGSKHVVEILKSFYCEQGQGTNKFDPKEVVSRIYLEYCDNGDMYDFIRTVTMKYSRDDPLPEETIWSIWECLARGLCVLAHGNENVEGPNHETWDHAIAHFDLKPENLLIGDYDENHPNYQIVKISDLGMGKYIPDPQTREWVAKIGTRGTPEYVPPEQHSGLMVLTKRSLERGDIWQMGKVMYELIKRGRTFDRTSVREVRFDEDSKYFATFGGKIRFMDSYSMALKKTVLKCLAVDPKNRPTPRQLLKDCQLALSALPATTGTIELGKVSEFGRYNPKWNLLLPQPKAKAKSKK